MNWADPVKVKKADGNKQLAASRPYPVNLMTRKQYAEVSIPANDPLLAELLEEQRSARRTAHERRWMKRSWGGVVASGVLLVVLFCGLIYFRLHPWLLFPIALLSGAPWWFWPMLLRIAFRRDPVAVFLRANKTGQGWEAFPSYRNLDAGLLKLFDAALKAVFPGLERPPGGAPRVTSPRALWQMVRMDVEKMMVRKQLFRDQLKDPSIVLWGVVAIGQLAAALILVITAPAGAPVDPGLNPGGTLR